MDFPFPRGPSLGLSRRESRGSAGNRGGGRQGPAPRPAAIGSGAPGGFSLLAPVRSPGPPAIVSLSHHSFYFHYDSRIIKAIRTANPNSSVIAAALARGFSHPGHCLRKPSHPKGRKTAPLLPSLHKRNKVFGDRRAKTRPVARRRRGRTGSRSPRPPPARVFERPAARRTWLTAKNSGEAARRFTGNRPRKRKPRTKCTNSRAAARFTRVPAGGVDEIREKSPAKPDVRAKLAAVMEFQAWRSSLNRLIKRRNTNKEGI